MGTSLGQGLSEAQDQWHRAPQARAGPAAWPGLSAGGSGLPCTWSQCWHMHWPQTQASISTDARWTAPPSLPRSPLPPCPPQPPTAQTQGWSCYSSGLGAQSEDLKAKSVSDSLGSFAQLDCTASRASSSSQEGGSAGLTVSLVWKGPCSLGRQHETFVQVRKRLALTRA